MLSPAIGLSAADDAGTWVLYLSVWTRWNHVRTLASAAGLVQFVLAIDAR